MPGKKAKSISEYINAAPKPAQKKLREMRATLKKVAPKAQKSIKGGIPAFSEKRILFMFAAFKHHIGLFPTSSALKGMKDVLSKYKTGKGSIQFPLDKPLPLPLIKRMTAFRARESKERDRKWRS